MIRRWRVEPDIEVETQDGLVPAVSVEALINATVDACVMAYRAGGGFSVWQQRYKTGLEGEAVTLSAIVEWRDRTDAKPAPERVQDTVTPEQVTAMYAAEPEPQDDPTLYRGGEYVDDIGDGIDPSALPEEDDSAVEEVAR